MSDARNFRPRWFYNLGNSWIEVGEYEGYSYFLDHDAYLEKSLFANKTFFRFKEQSVKDKSIHFVHLGYLTQNFEGIRLLKSARLESGACDRNDSPHFDMLFKGPFDVRKKMASLAIEQAKYLDKEQSKLNKSFGLKGRLKPLWLSNGFLSEDAPILS